MTLTGIEGPSHAEATSERSCIAGERSRLGAMRGEKNLGRGEAADKCSGEPPEQDLDASITSDAEKTLQVKSKAAKRRKAADAATK